MTRPPYLRWAAAALVLIVGLAIELSPPPTVDVPVAISDVPAGSTLGRDDVVWREAPIGLIDPIELPASLSRRVLAGAVVTAADIRPVEEAVPVDWWSIELPVPAATSIGDRVLAVLSTDRGPQSVEGVMSGAPASDGFSAASALVAFAPADAVLIAEAVLENRITVLVGR